MTKPLSPTHSPPTRARTAAQALAQARQAARAARQQVAALDGFRGAPHSQKIDPTLANPDQSAQVVASALLDPAAAHTADPFAFILAKARDAGFTDSFARSLATRLARSPEFFASGVELTAAQLIAALDDKMRMMLAHIDPVVVAEMKGRDLAITFGILFDKKRLLLDQPTEIFDTPKRRALDELIPAVLEEAARRGISIPSARLIDVTPEKD